MPHRPRWKRCWREPPATWRFRRMPATSTTPSRRPTQNLQEAMAHFADHCAPCHGNDGSGDTLYGKGLYPKPPDLRLAETQGLSDGELFWIIENGICFTGMPAFGGSHGSQDDWKTGTLHSAFAATDDGRTRGDGARQPERATRTRERSSLVRVGALSKRPQRPSARPRSW